MVEKKASELEKIAYTDKDHAKHYSKGYEGMFSKDFQHRETFEGWKRTQARSGLEGLGGAVAGGLTGAAIGRKLGGEAGALLGTSVGIIGGGAIGSKHGVLASIRNRIADGSLKDTKSTK